MNFSFLITLRYLVFIIEALHPARSAEDGTGSLVVSIQKNECEDKYRVSFKKSFSRKVDDMDAMKISEGYVNIAGLLTGAKLAVDNRGVLNDSEEIQLFVKGSTSGIYTLKIRGKNTFHEDTRIKLIDKYTNTCESINQQETNYTFQINLNDPRSQGTDRFTLTLDRRPIPQLASQTIATIYPNPFSDRLIIQMGSQSTPNAKLIIRNSIGATVSSQQLNLKQSNPEITVKDLSNGVYFMQLIDHNGKSMITFKGIKQ